MTAYVNQLKALARADQVKATGTNEAEKQAARERLSPLETRLEKLLATIPPEVQAEGLSLNALQTSLKGRWRGSCHPGELGSALRKLGYERRRQWTDEDGFRALWFPLSR